MSAMLVLFAFQGNFYSRLQQSCFELVQAHSDFVTKDAKMFADVTIRLFRPMQLELLDLTCADTGALSSGGSSDDASCQALAQSTLCPAALSPMPAIDTVLQPTAAQVDAMPSQQKKGARRLETHLCSAKSGVAMQCILFGHSCSMLICSRRSNPCTTHVDKSRTCSSHGLLLGPWMVHQA